MHFTETSSVVLLYAQLFGNCVKVAVLKRNETEPLLPDSITLMLISSDKGANKKIAAAVSGRVSQVAAAARNVSSSQRRQVVNSIKSG
eukprot:2991634-Amphidinium_carterae.1